MENYIGTTLNDRYEIIELIGSGGMAHVYKAIDTETDMTVAIKILKDEFLENSEIRRRFSNESKAIALLNHKNIVKIYDVSNDDELQYIVMELIDGITLKDYIKQEKVIGWKQAVYFASQILRGLQHAHDKGIVHRDIKPQNIMLLENGEIKITDFGIARFIGSETNTIQNSKRTIGSVHYIAPEQAKGDHTDERADIYSVGVILYEMLTGQLPFDGENTVSVAVMHLQADPRMPRSINPRIPEGLEEITLQAMQKDPTRRYQRASDMLMDLEDFKRDPGIHFEYRYMKDDSPTRYINAVYNARRHQEEEEYKREKSPVIPVLSGIAVAFIVVALVMVWLVLDESGIFANNTSGDIVVPKFIGENYKEVTTNPEYTFAFRIEWDFSNDYEEDQIMNQSPKPGKNVYSNSKVTLTVSKGVERLLVPEFSRKTYADYSQECIELNLVPSRIEVYNDNVESGFVINTNPLPRSDISEGDTVEIYVSQGKKPTQLLMPSCQNMTYTEAKAKLAAMGIESTSIEEVDSKKPAGTILSQEPAAGTEINESISTAVKFTVSNGKAPTNSVKISIPLPEGLSSAALRVEVVIDDETVYSETVNTSEKSTVECNIQGSGSSRTAKVYLAGSLYQTLGINFTSGEVKSTTLNPDYSVPTTPSTEAPVVDPVSEPEGE